MKFLSWITNLLGGGLLDRALDTVDKKIQSETDKEKIKGDIIKEHLRSRSNWMEAGGFWLLVMWGIPPLLWFSSVVLYSILWCQGCVYPQEWTIAALPPPLDEWGNQIMLASIGALSLTQLGRLRK